MPLVNLAEVTKTIPDWDDALADFGTWAIATAEAQLRLALEDEGVSVDALMADPLRAVLVKAAIQNAARRVLVNPSLARQWTETTGPFTRSETVDASAAAGLVYIHPDDLRRLLSRRRRSRYRTIGLRAGLGGW